MSAAPPWAENSQPYTGQVIGINSYMMYPDSDTCTTADVYNQMEYITCSFYNHQAMNNVHVVDWSASRSGGKFGWRDSSMQFVEAPSPVDWSRVTHYKVPGTTGPVTLTVRVDDDPHATDPETNTIITTADDPSVTAQTTITVVTNPYAATWDADTSISGAAINAPMLGTSVVTNTAVTCTAGNATDQDKKTSPSGYPGYPGMGGGVSYENDTPTYRWSATGGSFINPDVSNTTWSCSAPGNYTLTLTTDDQNDANLPEGDSGSRNDPAVVRTVQVEVRGTQPSWSPESGISGGISQPSSDLNLAPGGSILFTASSANDVDRRTAPEGTAFVSDNCTFSWSASGGTLSGDLTGSSVNWTAPNSAGDYVVTLRVDDQNDANKPPSEAGTRNDPVQLYTRTIHVFTANWTPDSAIASSGIIAPSSGRTLLRGQSLTCSTTEATDTDRRTAVDGGVTSVADSCNYQWTANGGSFSNGGLTPVRADTEYPQFWDG